MCKQRLVLDLRLPALTGNIGRIHSKQGFSEVSVISSPFPFTHLTIQLLHRFLPFTHHPLLVTGYCLSTLDAPVSSTEQALLNTEQNKISQGRLSKSGMAQSICQVYECDLRFGAVAPYMTRESSIGRHVLQWTLCQSSCQWHP